MAISFEQIEQLNSQVGDLVNSLKALDRNLVSTVRDTNAFDRAFGSLTNFQAFRKEINLLGNQQAKNFRTIADGLANLAQSVRAIPNDTDTILDRIGASLKSLREGVNAFRGVNTDRLQIFFKTIRDVFRELAQLRPITSDTRLTLGAISTLINTFQRLQQNTDTQALREVSDYLLDEDSGLFYVVGEVTKQLRQIGSINPPSESAGERITSSLNSISEIIRAFQALASNREDLRPNDINATAFDTIFDIIQKLTREIDRTASSIQASPESVRAIKGAINVVTDLLLGDGSGGGVIFRLAEVAQRLPNLDTRNLLGFVQRFGQLTPVFQIFRRVTRELASSLEGFSFNINVGDLSKLLTSFKDIVEFIPRLVEISFNLRSLQPNVLLRRIEQFLTLQPVFSIINAIFRNLRRNTARFSSGQAAELAELIEGFITLVKFVAGPDGLISLAQNLPSFRGERLLARLRPFAQLDPVFNLLAEVVRRFARIANRVGRSDGLNPTALENISDLIEAFARFARALPQLIRTATNLPSLRGRVLINRLRPLAQLDPLFAILRRFATSAGRIAGRAGDVGNLGGLSQLISAISKFSVALPNILRLARNLEGGVIPTPRNILARVNRYLEISKIFAPLRLVLRRLSEAARGIQDPGSLERLINIVKDVFELFEGSSGLSSNNVNFPDLRGFNQFIDQLADGLNRLQGVNVNTATLRAAGEALANFSNGNLSALGDAGGGGGGIGRRIADVFGERIVERFADTVIDSLGRATRAIRNFRSNSIQALSDVGDQFRNVGREIFDVGEQILRNFSLGNLAGSEAIDIAADFDDLSAQLQVFARDIPLGEAQEFADIIGIQYPLSANDALAAILDLAKAGQDFGAIRSILPTGADLAALSESGDLGQATEFLIAATGSFGEFADGVTASFENIEVAADIAFQAANASTASVDSITAGLIQAGPAARQYGLTLEEVSGILAVFEDAGKRGAEAGRLVGTVLQGFNQDKARDELTRLGIAFQNVDGTLRPLPDIIADVSVALEDVSEVERARSIRQFGDTFAQTGVSILLTKGGIDETVASFEAQGDAATAAQNLLNSFRGQVEQLRGSFETLLKNGALPLIDRFFLPFVQVARNVVDFFLTLPPSVIETASTFLLLATAIGTLTGAVVIATGAMTLLGGTFITASANALRLATIGLPRLIAGFGLFTASLATSVLVIGTLGIALLGLSDTISRFFRAIQIDGSIQQQAFQDLRDTATETFGEISRIVTTFSRVISVAFGSIFGGDEGDIAFSGITDGLLSLTERLRDFNTVLRNFSTQDIIDSVVRLSSVIQPILVGFAQTGTGLFQLLLGDITALGRIEEGLSAIAFGLTNIVQSVTGGDFFNALVFFDAGDFARGVSEFFAEIRNVTQNFIANNQDVILDVADFVLELFNPFSRIGNILDLIGLDGLSRVFVEIGEEINNSIRGVIDIVLTGLAGGDLQAAVERNFGELAGGIVPVAQEIGRALGVLSEIFNVFFSLLGSIVGAGEVSNFNETINSLLESVGNAIGFFTDNFLIPLRDNLPQVLGGIAFLIRDLVADFQPFIVVFEFAGQAVQNFIETLGNLFSGTANFSDLLVSAVEGIGGVLANLPRALGATISNIGNTIGSTLIEELGQAVEEGDIFGAATIIVNALIEAIGDALNNVGRGLLLAGERSGDTFLTNLGRALVAGDTGQVVQLLGTRVLEIIRGALQFAFDTLVNIFDEFLDQFDNRVVGGAVLVLGGTIGAIFFGVARALPGIIARSGFAQAVSQGVIGTLNRFLPARVASFILSLFGPAQLLLIAAGIAGVLGTLIFTIFNDPDVLRPETILRGTARRIVDTFEEELEDRAARSDLDEAVFGGLLQAFNASRITDRLAGEIDSVTEVIGEQIRSGLSTILGEDTVITNIIVANIQQPLEALSSIIAGIGVLFRGFITNIANSLELLRTVADFVVRAFQRVTGFLDNFSQGFANIARVVAVLTLAITAAVVAYRIYTSQVAQAAAATAQSTVASTADAAAKTAQAVATNAASAATGRFNISARGLIKTLGRFAAIAVLFQAATVAFEGLGDALQVGEERGFGAGIVEFFRSISVSVLEILGLNDLIPQVEENFRLLEIIVNAFAEAVGREFTRIINGIAVGLRQLAAQTEILAESLTGETATAAREFFAFGDLIANQFGAETRAEVSTFFAFLNRQLDGATDREALAIQLRANVALIDEEFDRLVAQDNDLINVENLREAVSILGESGALIDQIRNEDLTATGQFNLAIEAFDQGLLTRGLGQQFVNELFDDDATQAELQNIGRRQGELYAQSILDFIASGVIDEDQGNEIVNQFGLGIVDGEIVLEELVAETQAANLSFGELFQTIEQSNIVDLTEQFNDGKISIDEYAKALTEANSAIAALNDTALTEGLTQLNEDFLAGDLDQNVFVVESERLIEEALEAGTQEIDNARANLTDALLTGAINIDEFEKQVEILDGQQESLAQRIAEQRELIPLRIDLQLGRIDETEFANQAQDIIREIDEQFSNAGGADLDLGLDDDVDNINQLVDGAQQVGAETEGIVGDLAEALEAVEEARKEFAENVAKINEDFFKDEQAQLAEIEEFRLETLRDAAEAEADFNRETERRREDHQKKLKQIDAEGQQAIVDAVANRDSAAAQAAVRRREASRRQENQTFSEQELRRQQDFQLEQERTAARAELRRQELEEELALIAVERDQKIAAEREKLREVELANKQALDAEARFNQERINQVKQTTNILLDLLKKFNPEAAKLVENGAGAVEALIQTTGQNLLNFVTNTQQNVARSVGQGLNQVVNGVQDIGNSLLNQLRAAVRGSDGLTTAERTERARQIAENESGSGGAFIDSSFRDFGGPRRDGGPITNTQFFEVQDTPNNEPELFTQAGRTFLIPGRNGMVVPPTRTPRLAGAGGGGGMGSLQLNVDFSNMQISGVDGNPDTLVSEIETRVVGRLRNVVQEINGARRGFG